MLALCKAGVRNGARASRECRAIEDVEAGRFAAAVDKCKSRWASLPGAGYQQHEHKLADLQQAYTKAGGVLA